MAVTEEQNRRAMAVVKAMVSGAGEVMQRLHPDMKFRSWDELTDHERQALTDAWRASLGPLGTILSGRVATDAEKAFRL